MLPSKAVDFDIVRVELSDSFIVELNPLVFRFLDVAEVVPEISTTVMENDSFQGELIVFSIIYSFLLVSGIVVDIKVGGELQP